MPDDSTRRDVLKAAGLAGAGALGSLAGCTGGDGDGGDGGSGQQTDTSAEEKKQEGASSFFGGTETETEGSESTETADGGGGGETVTLDFWSGLAAESRLTKEHFNSEMKRFEEMKGNVEIKMEMISYGDMTQKISTVVQGGNPPDLGEPGSAGIQFYLKDQVVDHGPYIEEAEGIPDNWTAATLDAAKFRGDWWATGQNRHNVTLLTLRPKMFKQVGIDSPDQVKTWTDFRRALNNIQEEYPDAWAFEETGAFYDLEAYWGEARTAWTDGKDPWIRGDPSDPTVLVGEEGRTDGMIKNTIDLSKTYSSPKSPDRADEEIPPLMLTDKVASMTSGLGTAQRWKAVKEDLEYGWDGDVWMGPDPKLDPNYGDEFDIPELSGHEGQHGGHAWALLMQKQIFSGSDHPDLAWDLARFTNVDEDFIVPLVGDIYTAIPSYVPYMDRVIEEYDPTQMHQAQIDAINEYGPQYSTTGAAWDLDNTDPIRWTAINETISQAMAGQYTIDETPGLIRERIMENL